MDSVASDSRLQFISSPDIESNARSSRAFSAIEAGNNRESIVSRSRLLSRTSYHHYTQSIYSELNRARGLTHIHEENKAEHIIPVLDKAESIKMIRNLKKGTNNDWEVQIYLEDASTSSRESFKAFSWKLASNNALFFSYESHEEKIGHHKPLTTDTNFIYLAKEDTPDINSTDVFFERKDDEEKLGRVSKYGGQDAEDVIVTDTNGALLYKIVEDLKPASEDFACIVLDLLGNKVGNGSISLLETDALSCQINFPQETTSKEKVLILTAFLFKLIQLGVGIQWNAINKTLASSIMSSESCLLCFLKGK